MKTYKIEKRVSKQAKAEIQRIIETHEKYKNCYFWSSGANAHTRRRSEQQFELRNPDVAFITKNGKLEVSMSYRESCKNIYYKMYVILDGQTKTIAAVKKLLK